MFDFLKKRSKTNPSAVLDSVEKAVYEVMKTHGFRRYGRTLHRFVSGDISQVINFQLGEARRGENHLLYDEDSMAANDAYLVMATDAPFAPWEYQVGQNWGGIDIESSVSVSWVRVR